MIRITSFSDVPTSKTASLPQLWSPEMDRTNSGPQPSQSSLKKPAFNLSVFGTSSNVSIWVSVHQYSEFVSVYHSKREKRRPKEQMCATRLCVLVSQGVI